MRDDGRAMIGNHDDFQAVRQLEVGHLGAGRSTRRAA
jgi:hypothetical protein